MKIGIAGGGFVGSAVARGFMEYAEVRVYDIMPERRTHGFKGVLECDFVFVCLPTPMLPDGGADVSAIHRFFGDCDEFVPEAEKTIFVIKSTVPIGTTEDLHQRYNGELNILHSPEFLTARCAKTDFQMPARNIIGSPCKPGDARRPRKAENKLEELYRRRFPGVPVLRMHSRESELVKYACNSFFATKIAYFNEIFQLAKALELDWDRVLEGMLSDGRIAHSHTKVPGPDGQLGFGGACLPKDINALMRTMVEAGIEPRVTKAAWELNCEFRQDVGVKAVEKSAVSLDIMDSSKAWQPLCELLNLPKFNGNKMVITVEIGEPVVVDVSGCVCPREKSHG